MAVTAIQQKQNNEILYDRLELTETLEGTECIRVTGNVALLLTPNYYHNTYIWCFS